MPLALLLIPLAVVALLIVLQRSRGERRQSASRDDGSTSFLIGTGDGRGRGDTDGDDRNPDTAAGDGADSGGGGDGGD
ncbi:MAG: hypothetical protein KA196_06180 [Arenimonas sp.]|nr:hypothetical protein [Arenimonas sp.]